MANTKLSAFPAGIVPVAADKLGMVQAGVTVGVTASQLRQYVGEGLSNASTASVAAGYAVDTYLAGSAITIPTAGGWRVGTVLRWTFDMTKTAAGVAAPTIIVRMGTLGTTGDAAILTLAFAAGTAAADQGCFDVIVVFRSIGAGTAAVIEGVAKLVHNLVATGLIGNNVCVISNTSAGFASTTQTIIGLSFNGGASFSGTNVLVAADADNI